VGRPPLVYECAGCGEPTLRRGRARSGVRCINCSIDRHEEAVRQIRAGSGEHYEAWVAGLLRAMQKRKEKLDRESDLVVNKRTG
jgi:hypothetical protein